MRLSIGIIIYWASRYEEDHAVISGMWYFQEMFVPSTKEEKIKSLEDLNDKRCTVLNIHGKFNQIVDILSLGDRFIAAGENEMIVFDKLINEIKEISIKAHFFDDVYHPKGTALTIDTFIEVDETMDEIREKISKWTPVDVTISESWSLSKVIIESLQWEQDRPLMGYKLRHGLSKQQEAVFNKFTSLSYTAGQILNDGYISFENYAYELIDDFGDGIVPLLKKLYLAYKDWPGQDEITSQMDTIESVYETDMVVLLEKKKNNFRLEVEDFDAIAIAKNIMRKILKKEDLQPNVIVGIGHYLQAIERLPLITKGINVHIEICYTNSGIKYGGSVIYVFRITDEFFHIDIEGIERSEYGSDSVSYPSWYIYKSGSDNNELELSTLEQEIDEYLNLGVEITVEDFSKTENIN